MNLARFSINGNASTNGGFDVANSGAVSFALESTSGIIRKVEYWVKSSADTASPESSRSAPELQLVGATTGNRVQAITPNSAVTTTAPSTGAHSWIVRCVVNDGVNADGAINPDYWFERILSVRSSNGRRKIIATEGTQYSPRGWADAQNDDVDAVVSSSGAPTTAHYIVTEPDPALTNAHILSSTPSIQWSCASGEIQADCSFGTTSGTCCEGNDSRLSNDRASSGIRTATTLVSCSSAAAPSAGQSLVATSSTSATWQTVCLSSDARLPTTPAELTTGQKLIVSGASVKTSGRLGAWWNCGVVPTANANSTSSVTVLGLDVRPGDPVRILDKTGIFYSATTPRINQLALAGLKGSLADYRGRIHYKAVDLGSNMARIDVYDSEACTNRIGYTANFSTATTTTLTLAYTSTGTQGVTGTVYVYNLNEAVTCDRLQSIGLFATGICTAYNRSTGLLTFAGQAVSNVPGCILEVWLGDPRLVQVMDLSFGGSYANATSATAFADKQCRTPHWDLPSSTLVQILVRNSTADTTTAPTVNLKIDGNDALSSPISVPVTTTRASSLVLSNPYYNALSYGSTLEISVTKNGTGDARDLEFVIVAVED